MAARGGGPSGRPSREKEGDGYACCAVSAKLVEELSETFVGSLHPQRKNVSCFSRSSLAAAGASTTASVCGACSSSSRSSSSRFPAPGSSEGISSAETWQHGKKEGEGEKERRGSDSEGQEQKKKKKDLPREEASKVSLSRRFRRILRYTSDLLAKSCIDSRVPRSDDRSSARTATFSSSSSSSPDEHHIPTAESDADATRRAGDFASPSLPAFYAARFFLPPSRSVSESEEKKEETLRPALSSDKPRRDTQQSPSRSPSLRLPFSPSSSSSSSSFFLPSSRFSVLLPSSSELARATSPCGRDRSSSFAASPQARLSSLPVSRQQSSCVASSSSPGGGGGGGVFFLHSCSSSSSLASSSSSPRPSRSSAPSAVVPSCGASSSACRGFVSLVAVHCQLDDFFSSSDFSASRTAELCAKSPYEASTALAKEHAARRFSLHDRRSSSAEAYRGAHASATSTECQQDEGAVVGERRNSHNVTRGEGGGEQGRRKEAEEASKFSLGRYFNDGQSLGARLLRRRLIEAVSLPLRDWNHLQLLPRQGFQRTPGEEEDLTLRSLLTGRCADTVASCSSTSPSSPARTGGGRRGVSKETEKHPGETEGCVEDVQGENEEVDEDGKKKERNGQEETKSELILGNDHSHELSNDGLSAPHSAAHPSASSPSSSLHSSPPPWRHTGDKYVLRPKNEEQDEQKKEKAALLVSVVERKPGEAETEDGTVGESALTEGWLAGSARDPLSPGTVQRPAEGDLFAPGDEKETSPDAFVACVCMRGVAHLEPSQWVQASEALSMILGDFHDAAVAYAFGRRRRRSEEHILSRPPPSAASSFSLSWNDRSGLTPFSEKDEQVEEKGGTSSGEGGAEEEQRQTGRERRRRSRREKRQDEESDEGKSSPDTVEMKMRRGASPALSSPVEDEQAQVETVEGKGFPHLARGSPRLLLLLEWDTEGDDESLQRATEDDGRACAVRRGPGRMGGRDKEGPSKSLLPHVTEWVERVNDVHNPCIRAAVVPREEARFPDGSREARQERTEAREEGEGKETQLLQGQVVEFDEEKECQSTWGEDDRGKLRERASEESLREEQPHRRGRRVQGGEGRRERGQGAEGANQKETTTVRDVEGNKTGGTRDLFASPGADGERVEDSRGKNQGKETGDDTSSFTAGQEEVLGLLRVGDHPFSQRTNSMVPKRPCMTFLCGSTFLPAPPTTSLAGVHTLEKVLTSPDFLHASPYGLLFRQIEELVYLPLLLRLCLLSAVRDDEEDREGEVDSPLLMPGSPIPQHCVMGSHQDSPKTAASEPARETESISDKKLTGCKEKNRTAALSRNDRSCPSVAPPTTSPHLTLCIDARNRRSGQGEEHAQSLGGKFGMKPVAGKLRTLHEHCKKLLLSSSSHEGHLPPPPRLLIYGCGVERSSRSKHRESLEENKGEEDKRKESSRHSGDLSADVGRDCSSMVTRMKKEKSVYTRPPSFYLSPQQVLRVLGERYSREIQTYFLPVSALASPYVGQTEVKLRKLLREAVEASPSVLVLVGIDQLAAKRQRGDRRGETLEMAGRRSRLDQDTREEKEKKPSDKERESDAGAGVYARSEEEKRYEVFAGDRGNGAGGESLQKKAAQMTETRQGHAAEATDDKRSTQHYQHCRGTSSSHTGRSLSSRARGEVQGRERGRQSGRGGGGSGASRPFQRRLLASLLVGLDELEDYRKQCESDVFHSYPAKEDEGNEDISFPSDSRGRVGPRSSRGPSCSSERSREAACSRRKVAGMAVVGIANSARPESLDEAITRAGRLDTWVSWCQV